MFTGLIARLGLGLLFGRIRSVAEKIPRQVWIVLAALVVLALGWHLHASAVRDARAEGLAEGKQTADRQWSAAIEMQRADAARWRKDYETTATALTAEIGARHAQELRIIAARADDLRLRGPGRAAASCERSGDPAGLPATPGGLDAAPGAIAGGVAGMPPDGGPFATLPWPELVAQAEQADENRAEVKAWRDWYAAQKAKWERARANLAAQLPEPGF